MNLDRCALVEKIELPDDGVCEIYNQSSGVYFWRIVFEREGFRVTIDDTSSDVFTTVDDAENDARGVTELINFFNG